MFIYILYNLNTLWIKIFDQGLYKHEPFNEIYNS